MTEQEMREKIEELEEQVRQLKESIMDFGPMPEGMPDLTNREEGIVRTMLHGKMVRITAIIAAALPGHIYDPDAYLKVYIRKLRIKFVGTRFGIENIHGRGYRLTGIDPVDETPVAA